jgi:hypothetical protein
MPTYSENMNFTLWSSLTDQYDSSQLAANWTAVDVHDHTTNKGVKVPNAGLVNNTVTIGSTSVALGATATTIAGLTLTTPNIGAATATSVNKVTITAPTTSATLTLADSSTFVTIGAYSTTLRTTATTDITLPTTGTVATTSNKISDFASSTSSELAGKISNETGGGLLVFNDTPSLYTPEVLGFINFKSPVGSGKTTITASASNSVIELLLPATNGRLIANEDSKTVSTEMIADGAITGGTAGNGVKIAANTITNANISNSAAIADTKLATISTAGKVANSATTAAVLGDGGTIVLRNNDANIEGTFIGTIKIANELSGTGKTTLVSSGTSNTNYTLYLPPLSANGTIITSGDTNTVTSTILKSDAVTDSNRAVTTNHVRDAAVTTAKIATLSPDPTGTLYDKVTVNNKGQVTAGATIGYGASLPVSLTNGTTSFTTTPVNSISLTISGGTPQVGQTITGTGIDTATTITSVSAGTSPFTIGLSKYTTGVASSGTYNVSSSAGDEYYYTANPTNGVVWHLRYSGPTNKWEYVGGAPLGSIINTSTSEFSSSSYAWNPTGGTAGPGPSLVVPLAGTYRIEFGFDVSSSNNDKTAGMGLFTSTANNTLITGAELSIPCHTNGATYTSAKYVHYYTFTTAPTIYAQFNITANTATVSSRWISITPSKLG